MKLPAFVPYSVAVAGGWLVYAAVLDAPPLGTLRDILAGSGAWPKKKDAVVGADGTVIAADNGTGAKYAATATTTKNGVQVGDGSSRPYSGYASNVPVASWDKNGHPVPELVGVWGQPDKIRLAPVAATALGRWLRAYGKPFVISSGYRPMPASDTAPASRAPDAPIKAVTYTGHASGEAVDLSLGAMGVNPYAAIGSPERAAWDQLLASAGATGWENWTLKYAATEPSKVEAWHFSMNGRH